MGAEAKRYLQEHAIPQLFEQDPLHFLETSIQKLRSTPGMPLKWDSFVTPSNDQKEAEAASKEKGHGPKKKDLENESEDGNAEARPRVSAAINPSACSPKSSHQRISRDSSHPSRKSSSTGMGQQPNEFRSRQNSWNSGSSRPSSLIQAANNAIIPPDAPIILFMGGPGGGKTRYASQLQQLLRDDGLVHICMPDLIRTAIARYKDRSSEWRVASERYQRGELIPNELAQQLVKAEMGRHPHAKAYFLEGFPREARQVEDFERNVRPVDMALILDYDEEVLRRHMHSRGLLPEAIMTQYKLYRSILSATKRKSIRTSLDRISDGVIDRRIGEFKQKTLPSAKYFDDQRMLHLIPGEKEDAVIVERMRKLVLRAIRAGVGGGVTSKRLPTQNGSTTTSSRGGAASSATTSSGGGEEQQQKKLIKDGVQQPKEAENNGLAMEKKNGTVAEGNSNALKTNITEQAPIIETKATAIQSTTSEEPLPTVENVQKPSTSSSSKTKTSRPDSSSESRFPPTPSGEPQTSSHSAGSRPKTMSAGKAEKVSAVNRIQSGSTSEKGGRHASSGIGPKSSVGSRSNAVTPCRLHEETRETPVERREGSSTMSTPKPGEGVYRDLMSNSVGPPTSAANNNNSPGAIPSASVPVVLIIGAPGSSKSKFAQRIAKKYDGFVFISLGELLRRKVLQNGEDELWTRIGKKMDAGEMIPMRICRELLYAAIQERSPNSWGFVIEGYPRTLAQSEDIESQSRIDLALLIDCTEQFCKDALRKRYQKEKEEGAERADDEESVARLRLAQFKTNTLPMLKHLDDLGKLRVVRLEGSPIALSDNLKIEGDTDEDKVFQEMCRIIENTVFIQDDGNGQSLNSSKHNSVDHSAEAQQNEEEQRK